MLRKRLGLNVVRESLLVGWDLLEEPVVLPVISTPKLEPEMGLSPHDESHRISSTIGLIIVLDRRVASQR